MQNSTHKTMKHLSNISFESIKKQEQFIWLSLQETLQYVQKNSPFYKQLFSQHHLNIQEIKNFDDFKKIPTTSKEDIQKQNTDFFCIDKNKIAEYTATSGTLGYPVHIALSSNDLERLAKNEQFSFEIMQINEQDTVQLMLTLDRQFMAGMAYYSGLKKINATIIRTGPGLPQMQVETMLKFNTTVLVAVPSFLLKIIEFCKNQNIDPNTLPVKKILCIGENIHNEKMQFNTLAQLIQEKWNIQLFSTYASTELQTAFTECTFQQGAHHQPELIYFEILDEQGNPLGAEEYGEITITHLNVEGTPLIRFRTGDIACFYDAPCKCGRNSKRLSPIIGRKKHMIKYKGTTLYPTTIFDILNQFTNIKEYVVEVKNNEFETDELILHLNISSSIDECEQLLKPILQSRLRIIPEIKYHSATEILSMQFPNQNRKPIKFLDHRKSISE